MALFMNVGEGGTEVTAIDLNTHAVLWRAQLEPHTEIFGDDSGLVMATAGGGVRVVDPRLGAVTAQASSVQNVEWAGHGFFVTNSPRMCVRTIERPDTCAWTAPSAPMLLDQFNYTAHVFGNGQWINTGDGVRYLVSGERAPFGADAGGTYPKIVYYIGDAPDRVLRVTTANNFDEDRTFQPWNTQTNTAVSPAVTARFVLAPDLPVYVAVDSSYPDTDSIDPETDPDTDSGLATARAWATGKQQWNTPNYSTPAWPAQFVGDLYVQQLPTPEGDITEARDPKTGEQVWRHTADTNIPLLGVIGTVLYLGRATGVGYDMADASKKPTTFESPTEDALMQVVGGHVIAYSYTTGEVYILND